MPGAVIGEGCNLGQNVVVMPRHPDRQQRADPEQRVDLRGRDPRGRRILRSELCLHQRDQSAEPREPEGGVPGDPGPARRYDRRQRHDHLRPRARGVLLHRRGGRGQQVDVPAYALMVGVPARRVGWMCQCGVRLVESSRGAWKCPACGTTYLESEGRLVPVARFAEAVGELARSASAAGDSGGAVRWWRRLLEQNSLNSNALVGLATALAAQGDRAAALGLCAQHEEELLRELELRPGEELVLLRRSLEAAVEPGPLESWHRRRCLPARPSRRRVPTSRSRGRHFLSVECDAG